MSVITKALQLLVEVFRYPIIAIVAATIAVVVVVDADVIVDVVIERMSSIEMKSP